MRRFVPTWSILFQVCRLWSNWWTGKHYWRSERRRRRWGGNLRSEESEAASEKSSTQRSTFKIWYWCSSFLTYFMKELLAEVNFQICTCNERLTFIDPRFVIRFSWFLFSDGRREETEERRSCKKETRTRGPPPLRHFRFSSIFQCSLHHFLFLFQMAKLAKMKILACEMFLTETDKYSKFDETVNILGPKLKQIWMKQVFRDKLCAFRVSPLMMLKVKSWVKDKQRSSGSCMKPRRSCTTNISRYTKTENDFSPRQRIHPPSTNKPCRLTAESFVLGILFCGMTVKIFCVHSWIQNLLKSEHKSQLLTFRNMDVVVLIKLYSNLITLVVYIVYRQKNAKTHHFLPKGAKHWTISTHLLHKDSIFPWLGGSDKSLTS